MRLFRWIVPVGGTSAPQPLRNTSARRWRVLAALGLVLALIIPWLRLAQPVMAAPVDWQEVPATADGRQWWDAGSLRFSKEGYLTILSRYQPASPATAELSSSDADSSGSSAADRRERPAPSSLYVMEIDCDESLYRDRSVNGFHQFSPQWQPVVSDDLIGEVIQQACAAALEPS